MPRESLVPKGSRQIEEKTTSFRVRFYTSAHVGVFLMNSRFMSDKIMPLSQAVEGYELFDNMKVQKGIRNIGSMS